jgi:hypothetical protein
VARVVPIEVDGVKILVETDGARGTEPTSAARRAQDAATDAFTRAEDAIVAVAGSAVKLIRRMGDGGRPDQLEVKFGIKFSAEGGVVLARAATEASLEVKLIYGAPSADRDDD